MTADKNCKMSQIFNLYDFIRYLFFYNKFLFLANYFNKKDFSYDSSKRAEFNVKILRTTYFVTAKVDLKIFQF